MGAMTGCYNQYKAPESSKVWTKGDFADCEYISIKDLKQRFYDVHGAAGLGKSLEINEDLYISGKVISSDRAGNVYKALYIYDEESQSAIELRMMVSNYVFYPVGQTIYVRLNGLCVGNYRYMLSVGMRPTSQDEADGYANRNMDNTFWADQYVFQGAVGAPVQPLVVNASNYNKLTDDDLGRLVRFEGMTYKEGTFDSEKYPNYLEVVYPNGSTTGVYTNKYFEDEGLPKTFAYNYNNDRYFGSSVFGYGSGTDFSQAGGNFIVRVSGYANFGLKELPENGTVGNMTAIYTKYSSKSGGFVKYQLLLNSGIDVDYE